MSRDSPQKDVSMTEEDTFLWQSMEGEGDGDLSLFLRENIYGVA